MRINALASKRIYELPYYSTYRFLFFNERIKSNAVGIFRLLERINTFNIGFFRRGAGVETTEKEPIINSSILTSYSRRR